MVLIAESFSSLMVALFWAFASDCTSPSSAKKRVSFYGYLWAIRWIICRLFWQKISHYSALNNEVIMVGACGL